MRFSNILSFYIFQGGCCFAFKMEYMDETTGEATFVSRFGTSDEPEQPWFDQTCGRTVSLKMLILTELLSNSMLI